MSFVDSSDGFSRVVGMEEIPLQQNIVYKTLLSLKNILDIEREKRVLEFFEKKSLSIKKRIPMMAGLGGGSSNSATFLKMVDETLELNLSKEEKLKTVEPIGSDIAFFLEDSFSADVRGRGELVTVRDEKPIEIEVFTPEISCNTGAVYREYRRAFLKLSSPEKGEELLQRSSLQLWRDLTLEGANDLYRPAVSICPELKNSIREGYLFSGSGSSFFRLKV
jgi:4-diphosphocytidyl-2-C-methyl-D-erythritol kinase